MKKISLKKMIIWIIILFIIYIVIDVIVNWDHAMNAFNKGFNDMNAINETKYGK